MKAEVITIFSKLIEMYMNEDTYEYDILSMTVIHDEKARYAMLVRFAEYDSTGHPNEYNLTFKIFLNEKNNDVDFIILDDYGSNCIETYQEAMGYTKEMIKWENAKYKDFLLKSFSNFF